MLRPYGSIPENSRARSRPNLPSYGMNTKGVAPLS